MAGISIRQIALQSTFYFRRPFIEGATKPTSANVPRASVGHIEWEGTTVLVRSFTLLYLSQRTLTFITQPVEPVKAALVCTIQDFQTSWGLKTGIMDIVTSTRALARSGSLDAEKDLDLTLFPDLQGLKNADSHQTLTVVSEEEHDEDIFDCEGTLDDDLMNYLNRESVPAVSPPALPNKGIEKSKGAPSKVKLVTLKQGFPRGGKIIVVEHKDGSSPVGNLNLSLPLNGNGMVMGAPTSPTSSNGDADSQNGQLCMSKNAIAARENRLRKKQNIERLEKQVSELTTENTDLKSNMSEMTSSLESLRNEVKYLKSVLANQSTLALLLKKIPHTSGITLSQSGSSSSKGIKRHPSTRKRPAPVETVDASDSDEEEEMEEEDCDCHPDKNVCMCSKENRHRESGVKKHSSIDHSYANGSPHRSKSVTAKPSSQAKRRKGNQRKTMEETSTAGVCLHVSGESVSLEFCSSCSNNAAHSRKTAN